MKHTELNSHPAKKMEEEPKTLTTSPKKEVVKVKYVTKRDGRTAEFDIDQITQRLDFLCFNLKGALIDLF